MADPFNVIAVPSITIDVENASPVIEVSIDKTGPSGTGTVDDTARASISSHSSDSIDPHGTLLRQSYFEVDRATVNVTALGSVLASQALNFSNTGCFTLTVRDPITLTVSLAIGQRGSVHILSAPVPPASITWAGVDIWLGGPPTFIGNRLTVVTLFNDGVRVVGVYGVQS